MKVCIYLDHRYLNNLTYISWIFLEAFLKFIMLKSSFFQNILKYSGFGSKVKLIDEYHFKTPISFLGIK